MRVVAIGAILTLGVAAALYAALGSTAIIPALGFGALATALQTAAVAVLEPARNAPHDRFVLRWGAGMALRLVGVPLVALSVLVSPGRFPPVPTAFGFLGVMVPLLFLELRRIR